GRADDAERAIRLSGQNDATLPMELLESGELALRLRDKPFTHRAHPNLLCLAAEDIVSDEQPIEQMVLPGIPDHLLWIELRLFHQQSDQSRCIEIRDLLRERTHGAADRVIEHAAKQREAVQRTVQCSPIWWIVQSCIMVAIRR